MKRMLVDSHCHLNFPELLLQVEQLVQAIQQKDFFALIDCSIDYASSCRSLALSSRYTMIYSSLGLHPYNVQGINDSVFEQYRKLLTENREKIKAFGEIGFDQKSSVPFDSQEHAFRKSIELAREFSLPLVIHNRGFDQKILQILDEYKPSKVVFHCFSQDPGFLAQVIARGYFISFAGNVTFKNASLLRQSVQQAPLERVLTETDSPYLAPQRLRGQLNTPLATKDVVGEISRVKGIPVQIVEEQVLQNSRDFFQL